MVTLRQRNKKYWTQKIRKKNKRWWSYKIGKVRLQITENKAQFRRLEKAEKARNISELEGFHIIEKNDFLPGLKSGISPLNFVTKNSTTKNFGLKPEVLNHQDDNNKIRAKNRVNRTNKKTSRRMHVLFHVFQNHLHELTGIRVKNNQSILKGLEENLSFAILESAKEFRTAAANRKGTTFNTLKQELEQGFTIDTNNLAVVLVRNFRNRKDIFRAIQEFYTIPEIQNLLKELNTLKPTHKHDERTRKFYKKLVYFLENKAKEYYGN